MIKTPRFQLLASLLPMMMIGNLQYTWTLFVEPIREAHGALGWQPTSIQAAYTLFIILQASSQPLSGGFMDKIGQRPFITLAGLLCGIGWSGLGFATELWQLKMFYAIAGIGAAFVYGGAIGSALKWYPHRRGFASGVIAAGYGGGSALFVWIMQTLIRDHGYSYAFLVSGIFQGIVIAVVAQFLRHPGADFKPPKPVAAASGTPVNVRRGTDNFTTGEMLRMPHFYLLYAMFVAMGVGGVFITSSSGQLVKTWGLVAKSAATATSLGLQGFLLAVVSDPLGTALTLGLIANAASRPFWGWIADQRGRERTMFLVFLLNAVFLTSVVTLGSTSGIMFILTLFLTYFTWGQIYSLFPSTIGDYFGTKHVTSNNSFLYSGKGVAALIGIYLPQLAFKALGSWSAVLYGSAILAILSAIGALVLRRLPLPKKAGAERAAATAV